MGKTVTLTDANGKVFEVKISDITDMTTDLDGSNNITLEDSEKHKITNFQATIVDSDNKPVDVNKLLDDAKKDPSVMPKAIDVLFEATHSGKNRNFFVYHSDSMEEDAVSWKTPFAKPFIKNHDLWEDPLGRVRDYYFALSELNPERDCINVLYRISDEDAIAKFLDGRYRTMSIAGSVNHISCGVCGKDILKDGVLKFCGHWRGEDYAGQKCFWNGRKIEYKEGSVVNSPADDWAQVKKITIVTNSTNDSADDKTSKDDAGMGKPNKQTKDDDTTLDQLDALAGTNPPVKDDENPPADTPPAGDDSQEEGTKDDNSDDGTKDDGAEDEETLDSVKLQRDNLVTENQTLKDENVLLEAKVADLETQVKDLSDQVNALTEELNKTKEDSLENRKTAVKFAVMNKKLMAQRIADFEVINNTLTEDKVEDRLNELIAKTAKDLIDMVNNLAVETVKEVRKLADQVNNPSNANPGENNTIDDKDNGKPDEKPQLSMKDLEDEIINYITR